MTSPWPLRSISEKDFLALLELFMEIRPRYADPYKADGQCAVAADEFRHLVRQLDLPLKIRDAQFIPDEEIEEELEKIHGTDCGCDPEKIFGYGEADHHWYRNGCKWGGHVATIVNGALVVDFTARQFNPDAPWPLVFPLPERQNKLETRAA